MSIFTVSSNSFRGQHPDEKTVFLTRRHWIVLLAPMIALLFLFFLPFIIYPFINETSWYNLISPLYWFLVAVYFLILWNIAFYNIMLYYLNTVIVTNKRVIENRQDGFFQYTLNELELKKIQDISIKILGPLATFFNFGDMEIQSAGAQPKFYFYRLPQPEKIKKIIMDLRFEGD